MITKYNVNDQVVLKTLPENKYTVKAISASQTEDTTYIHYKCMGLPGWVPEDSILGCIKYESIN